MGLIHLSTGALSLDLAPEIGGSISSCRHDGSDILRPATPEALEKGDPLGMACFPLVPFSNRVAEGRFEFGGRTVALSPTMAGDRHAIHGQGWRHPWHVEGASETAAMLTFDHGGDGDEWPWPYRATETFFLEDDALSIELSVANRSFETMPAGLGFHPYFPRDAETRFSARLPKMWEADEETLPLRRIDTPGAYDFSTPKPISGSGLDHCFEGWDGLAEIRWSGGRRAVLRAGAALSHMVVYVPDGEDFFCAEPVSQANDGFNLMAKGMPGTGVMRLAPGEIFSVRMELSIASE